MGGRLSLMAPSSPTVAISSYIDVIQNLKYVELINNSRFLKTIKAINTATGELLIVKVLIKPTEGPQDQSLTLNEVQELLAKELLLLTQLSALPWHKIIETDRAGYLIRQLVKTNLYDRISLRPFLEPIEKSFFVFQMLKIIDTVHNLHIHHGDLKLENFLVTSWNWLMLTDFATYTKPTYIPEDNPSQFYFYFDTSGRRVCYVAPERFYSSKNQAKIVQNVNDDGTSDGKDKLTDASDLFSLGCVITELYSDGEPTFTLSQLFRYMKDDFQPDLSSIENSDIREIATRLLSKNPRDRPSASAILEEYRGKCFPTTFYDFIYDFMAQLSDNDSFITNDENVSSSDLRIDQIHSSFDIIAKELHLDYTLSHNNDIFPLAFNLPGMPEGYKLKPTPSDESALIILNYVFTMMKSLKRPSSKLKACELIAALSERVSDECKLDRSIPYLFTIIDEIEQVNDYDSIVEPSSPNFASNVVCYALMTITTILSLCSRTTPVNVLLFTEYILPKLSRLTHSNIQDSQMVLIKITLASCLPSLAQISKRFYMMSNTLKTNTEDFNSVSRESLDLEFENLTLQLLTDTNALVKISLVNNILPLCEFFGVDKTNDIILPHLITYLNDPNFELKLAFLSSVLDIGPFVGVLSIEQYLLPLLVQTLKDLEQFVILKVLEIFANFVERKLINPSVEFNALEFYRELLVNSLKLLLHPNEWIRQSVLRLVLNISDNLTDADKFCFLYFHLKAYLSYDVAVIDWNTLYPCLTKPLSKVVFEMAITWSLNATKKSLFWHQKNLTTFDVNSVKKKKVVPFSKSFGKSVYLPPSTTQQFNGNLMSSEDKQWLSKLRAVGLQEKDIWKVFVLREFIYNVSRSGAYDQQEYDTEFQMQSNGVNIPPRNVFFETYYKSEPIAPLFRNKVDFFVPGESVGNGSLLSNISKVKASLQTVQANVLGELETSSGSYQLPKQAKSENSIQRVFSVNNTEIITSHTNHNYKGKNPYILNYLSQVELDPTLDSFSEFGPAIRETHTKDDWHPQQVHAATIDASIDSEMDSINCICVAATSEFFLTGSESGYLRLWDTVKLDKIANLRSSNLSVNLNSPITSIESFENRFVFSVTTKNSLVYLLRFDVARSKNKKIVRYMKPSFIRTLQLSPEEGHATKSKMVDSLELPTLYITTSTSKILGIDLIRMQKVFEVQNPLQFGFPTAILCDNQKCWLLVGSSNGVLCLWDMRFRILLKSFKITNYQHAEISDLILLPNNVEVGSARKEVSYFAMVGGTTETDITIWEIPTFQCTHILRSKPHYIDSDPVEYKLAEITSDINSLSVSELLETLSIEKNEQRQLTAVKCVTMGANVYLAASTYDTTIVLWNLTIPEDSIVLCGDLQARFITTQQKVSLSLISFPMASKEKSKSVHQDIINAFGFTSRPSQLVISVDRSGLINLFK